MKNVIKIFGLLVLICFSFFYTDRVMNILLEQDPIMVEIIDNKNKYEILPVNAVIDNDTIMPGISGKVVLEKESYNNMKNFGLYLENYLVFEQVKPTISIDNNFNKYIISGNKNKKNVSIIFIVSNKKQLNFLENKINSVDIKLNYFIDEKLLNSDTNYIKMLKNREIYNYGDNGNYREDKMLTFNNLLTRIRKNEAIYCLVKEKNDEILRLCEKNNLYTILPNLVINNNLYNEIKDKISNGSIILIDLNQININNLNNAINFIQSKGLNVVYLSDLLSENLD